MSVSRAKLSNNICLMQKPRFDKLYIVSSFPILFPWVFFKINAQVEYSIYVVSISLLLFGT